MNLFNFFDSKSKDVRISNTLKNEIIDNTYKVDIPENWIPYKSDRFRAKTKDKKIELSITNYSKPLDENEILSIENLKKQFLPLFDKFINEGGYISNNDLEMGDDYIYQSFKVDSEIQYYLYTHMIVNDNLKVIPVFIVRQKGAFNRDMIECLKRIKNSIQVL